MAIFDHLTFNHKLYIILWYLLYFFFSYHDLGLVNLTYALGVGLGGWPVQLNLKRQSVLKNFGGGGV